MDFTHPTSPQIGSVIAGRNATICMSYHESGKRLFIASETTLQVVDSVEGKMLDPPLRSERERIQLISATHHEQCILFASGSAVYYWSVHDNKILRKFRGHSDTITSIAMCPAGDTFLTASRDQTVRLWTLGQAGCVAQLQLLDAATAAEQQQYAPLVAYDYTGLVFAIAARGRQGQYHLHLYDAREYSGGAFAELEIKREDIAASLERHGVTDVTWKALQFNTSGDRIMVMAERGVFLVLDGFEGTIQRVFVSSSNRDAVCCFTPDDKTILQGNDDGSISCWNIETETVQKTLTGHQGPINCIAANPKFEQFASACTQTALWTW